MHLKTPLLLTLLFLAAGEAAATTLTATPAKLTQSDREITIRWSDLPDPDGLDHVAIYSPPSSRDRDFLGYLFLNGSASWRSGRGELALPRLPNLRAPYQFRLFRWPAKEYSYHHVDHDGNPLPHGRHRVAVSGDVAFDGSAARPEQVHLAFADGVDEMRVMFVCADGGKRSVRYGLGKEEGEKGWTEVGTEVRTYEQKHMCDAPANDSVGWRDPGFVFNGLMMGLEPGRKYFYKVGSDLGGWSETYSFISRDSEANETIAFLLGDMGTYVPYNTYIRTQDESLSTVKWILRDIEALGDKPAFISHIGDISYARGYSWVWDHFFSQIEPIAASTPYHVCIGNHEYDWPSHPWKPSWSTYGKDGGGECGIPYSVKFRMPGNSILPTGNGAPDTRNLYYSFNSGVVHFVYMSTETNFVQGSDQHNFLKADLEKVNRSRTPFVVFQGHRPMYTTSDETQDSAMRQQMVQHLEPLLVTYNVTLALWGHVHRYERFCPIKNLQCLNTSSSFVYPGAPVHVVIGMGGQDWQPIWQPRTDHPDVPIYPQPGISMYRGGEFGYTKLVATREKLTLTYLGNHDGQVHDMVEIFSEQTSGEDSAAKAVVGTKLGSAASTKLKISPLYLEIGGSVMLALILGFAFGFLVRKKREAAQWTPVKNDES